MRVTQKSSRNSLVFEVLAPKSLQCFFTDFGCGVALIWHPQTWDVDASS